MHGGEGGKEERDVSRIQIVKKRSLDFSLKQLGAYASDFHFRLITVLALKNKSGGWDTS